MKKVLLILLSGIMTLPVCQSQIKVLFGGTLIDGFAGITSARDLGGPLEESIAVRDAINKGKIPRATM